MPNNDAPINAIRRSRRAAYSVAEVARLCKLSRARFYELVAAGVMPPPVYALRTRRPLYTAELAACCVEVRETGVGMDDRFVLFYEPRAPRAMPLTAIPSASARRRQPVLDPLAQEMVETLRATGVQKPEAEIVEAIRRRCPQGLTEQRFEIDLVLLRADLNRPSSA